MATATDFPSPVMANAKIPVAASLPSNDMSDSALMKWYAANQNKVVFGPNGEQRVIPPGASGVGNVRYWMQGDNGILRGATLKNPETTSGGGTAATSAARAATAGPQTTSSYFGGEPTFNNAAANPASTAAGVPSPMAAGNQDAFGIKQTGTGPGYTLLQNAKGQGVAQDNAGNYFQIDAKGNHVPLTDNQAMAMGFQSANPETRAQQLQKEIDPTGEALRGQVGQSYLDTLNAVNKPKAADYQSYLDTFKAVDPEEYAQRKGLATSMDAQLKAAQDQNALGSQLDPSTVREIEQGTRAGQAARGNIYGTPQLTQEVMQRGQQGEARAQQRLGNLNTALGQQQSYLGAGLGLGDTAMGLYQQGLANKSGAAGNALSYLGSGQTPYQSGAAFADRASGNAATSAQGGPQYNPAALGSQYSGSQFPQYGLDVGQQAQNYYNSLATNQNAQGPVKNKGASALTGAASGAISGATTGSAFGPYGTLIGGAVGAIGGGAMGYFS